MACDFPPLDWGDWLQNVLATIGVIYLVWTAFILGEANAE